MLVFLLELPAWAITVALALTLGATGAFIHWLCFMPATRAWALSFAGIVAPFYSSPAILFALLSGFLANDAWVEDRRAAALALEEHDAIAIIMDLTTSIPAETARLRVMARDYVRSAVADELSTARQRRNPKTEAALATMLHEVTAPEVGRQTGSPLQAALIGAVERVSAARSGRLAMSGSQADDAKWFAAMALAVLSQIGAATVHLERRRAQALALTIYTLSAIVLLSLIATCEQPYLGSHQDAIASLREFLVEPSGG